LKRRGREINLVKWEFQGPRVVKNEKVIGEGESKTARELSDSWVRGEPSQSSVAKLFEEGMEKKKVCERSVSGKWTMFAS